MATVKAAGYSKTAISSQANQAVINRHVWDCTVQAASDKILIGRLPAGHRIVPELCSLYANAAIPVINVDLCVGADANALLDNFTTLAATALVTKPDTTSEALYALLETIGVDFNQDRDIYLLINSGAATAPAGSKVIATIASYAASTPD